MGPGEPFWGVLINRVKSTLNSPQIIALMPAVMLGAYWAFGELGLIACAICLPVLYALTGMLPNQQESTQIVTPSAPFDVQRGGVIGAIDKILKEAPDTGRTTGCFVVSVDDFPEVFSKLGPRAIDQVLDRIGDRLRSTLRSQDVIGQLDRGTFAVAMAPVARIDLETMLQVASRLQTAIAEPIILDATRVYVTASVGFCQPNRAPSPSGASILEAGEAALEEARHHGPGSIRAYSADLHRRCTERSALIEDVRDALEIGQIKPWFQPQISTDTGRVSGFEALARWEHPERGIISPGELLPAIDQAGLMERLGEVMLAHSLTAIKAWDRAGLHVPSVGVNFSPIELRNPNLIEKIQWELDRYDIAPERLTVEVLETVIAGSKDDTTARNISELARLGCQIDLDDFGTGHASITNIRRFSVNRIKIDRSFVIKVNEDREQQRMVAAILTMAERLDLETLAEGVETVGEHTMLAQLGCGHVQGYGIGRPMPFEETCAWLTNHDSKLAQTPTIGRKTG
ncbi:MAG: putative bifunctional diguanylate cyclase/phosphodiesterase [Mangrovicoccus sp.]